MEKNKPYLSVVIIHRRAGKTIKGLLESLTASDLTGQQIVLVDTGPNDQDIESKQARKIIDKFKKKHEKIDFVISGYTCPDEWEHQGNLYIGDFAKAREYAHSLADGLWHFSIDADDQLKFHCSIFSVPSILREIVQEYPEVTCIAALYEYQGLTIQHDRPRFWKSTVPWVWQNALHETRLPIDGGAPVIYKCEDLRVVHAGDPKVSEERNKQMVLQIMQKGNGTPRIMWAFSVMLYKAGKFQEGIAIVEDIFKDDPKGFLGYKAALTAADGYCEINNPDGAERILGAAIATHPEERRAYIQLGMVYTKRGLIQEASMVFEKAFFKVHNTNKYEYLEFHEEDEKFKGIAAQICAKAGNFTSAYQLANSNIVHDGVRAEERRVSAARSITELAEYLVSLGRLEKASKLVNDLCPSECSRGIVEVKKLVHDSMRKRKDPPMKTPRVRGVDSILLKASLSIENPRITYISDNYTKFPKLFLNAWAPSEDTDFCWYCKSSDGREFAKGEIKETYIQNDISGSANNTNLIILDSLSMSHIQQLMNVTYTIGRKIIAVIDRKVELEEFTTFVEKISYNQSVSKIEKVEDLFIIHTEAKKSNRRVYQKRLDIIAKSPFTWGPQAHKTQGIGGSEQAVIHLAPLLAKEFEVHVWADVLEHEDYHKGVFWHHAEDFDPSRDREAVVVWRDHKALEMCKGYPWPVIFWSHDVPQASFVSYLLQADKIWALSGYHAELFKKIGIPEEKIDILRNGISVQALPKTHKTIVPHSNIYCSSAMRGLLPLLRLWPRVLEIEPDATLNVCYSFDLLKRHDTPRHLEGLADACIELVRLPGIIYHGGLPHEEFLEVAAQCQNWVYPTIFPEISCIVAMETQALGLRSVTTNKGALAETVLSGPLLDYEILENDLNVSKHERQTGEVYNFEGLQTSENFLDMILDALMNPSTAKERADLAQKAQQFYAWENALPLYVDAIQKAKDLK